MITLISLILALVIIINEGRKIGTANTTSVSLDKNYKYSYDISSGLTLMLVNWFYIDELISRA